MSNKRTLDQIVMRSKRAYNMRNQACVDIHQEQDRLIDHLNDLSDFVDRDQCIKELLYHTQDLPSSLKEVVRAYRLIKHR